MACGCEPRCALDSCGVNHPRICGFQPCRTKRFVFSPFSHLVRPLYPVNRAREPLRRTNRDELLPSCVRFSQALPASIIVPRRCTYATRPSVMEMTSNDMQSISQLAIRIPASSQEPGTCLCSFLELTDLFVGSCALRAFQISCLRHCRTARLAACDARCPTSRTSSRLTANDHPIRPEFGWRQFEKLVPLLPYCGPSAR